MQYTYVAWLDVDGRWQAMCPAWPALLARGQTREACVEALSEKLTENCSELFCRELPLPHDIAVQVGALPVLESETSPWG